MEITSHGSPTPSRKMELGVGPIQAQEPSKFTENVAPAGKTGFNAINIYRISLSLILGLVGFSANFWYAQFDVPPFEARIYPGLIFPVLVSLAWGWRFGLLSATLGLGCQTLWFTSPAHPVEPYVTVPLLTLWVVWHGYSSTQLEKARFPGFNPYIAELIFRLFSTALLDLLLHGLLQWQLSDLSADQKTGGQLNTLIHLKAVEQAVNGYIAILMADILLNLSPVRSILKLDRRPGQRTAGYVIGAAVVFSLLFWIIDGLVDFYKFNEHLRFLIFKSPESLMDSILYNISTPDLFARAAFVVTCLTGGALVYHLLRKRLEGEAALRESELRYRRLYESMWDAFLQTDMVGRIVDCNQAFEQMIGYEKSRLLNMREAELVPEPWQALNADIMSEQIIPKGRSDIYEKEYTRSNGTTFVAELRTFLITHGNGDPYGMWSIVRDISQRKERERERERESAIAALKRSNEDLRQFAYSASHDLQEPLRMVSSYTQLLADRYAHQLDEKAHKYIHYAVDGAARMQALIRDLLSFSRVETHAREFENVDAHSALGVAVANLKSRIDETSTLLTTEDLPMVRADKIQLTQVFQNLIGNGIKFRKTSSTPTIHVAAKRQKRLWRFSVTDNGIGIDPKYKEKIFVVFQRLHTHTEFPGTGIGLALCKRIIERHGGKIWFTSEPGKGTTFYFTIHPESPPPFDGEK